MVVGSGFDQYGDAVRSVSFVDDFLVVGLFLAGGFLDGAFNVVLGHVGRFGVLDGHAKAQVVAGVVSSFLDGHRDFLADAGESFAHVGPAFELGRFAVFECSTHGGIFCLMWYVCF